MICGIWPGLSKKLWLLPLNDRWRIGSGRSECLDKSRNIVCVLDLDAFLKVLYCFSRKRITFGGYYGHFTFNNCHGFFKGVGGNSFLIPEANRIEARHEDGGD